MYIRSYAQHTSAETPNDGIVITIMMKHHQDKNIDELCEIREKNGFTELFPPPSARVISWFVMMGIGQVVTVKIPASELRNLNISVKKVFGAPLARNFILPMTCTSQSRRKKPN